MFLSEVLAADSPPKEVISFDNNIQIQQNHANLKKYQNIVNKKSLTSEISKKKSSLLIPVTLFVFDDYYSKLSEFKYLDKYLYQDNIFVFNTNHKNKFNNYFLTDLDDYWLTDLKQTSSFEYVLSTQQPSASWNSMHIDWIDNEMPSGIKLKNIVKLFSNIKSQEPFTNADKIINLEHDFSHDSKINWYSGYWLPGNLNNTNNLIKKISYGKLKPNARDWKDIYHKNIYENEKNSICKKIDSFPVQYLTPGLNISLEGYESICNTLNISSFFPDKFPSYQHKFTTGYAAFKTESIYYYQNLHYYYLLGNLIDNAPKDYAVNSALNPKTSWYVDYNELFIPELKKTELVENNKYKLHFDFDLNYQKIKNIDNFLNISSGLNFEFNFLCNGKPQKFKLNLENILNSKEEIFEIEDSLEEIKSLTNFFIKVSSNNSLIKLISPNKEDGFNFFIDTSKLKQNDYFYDQIIIHYDDQKKYYYSELKKLNKENFLFYFFNHHKNKKQNLNKSDLFFLKTEFIGSDLNTECDVKYYDFFTNIQKSIKIKNLLILPKFPSEILFNFDKKPVLDFLKNNFKNITNDYFWENLDLVLKKQDVFDGINNYEIKNLVNSDLDLEKHYQNNYFSVQSNSEKYLLQHENQTDYTKDTPLNNFFYLSERAKQKKIKLSDFIFKKINETDWNFEIEVEFKEKNDLDNVLKKVYLINKKVASINNTYIEENLNQSRLTNNQNQKWNINSEIDNLDENNSYLLNYIIAGTILCSSFSVGILSFWKK